MPKKTEELSEDKKTKKIKADRNNKWEIAYATDEETMKALLSEDYEPFSVDQGLVWFKKK
jgi:hypothetical protein